MIRDDWLLRQIEQMAKAIVDFFAGEGTEDDVRQAVEQLANIPLSVIDMLPAEAIVPPTDDLELRWTKAEAMAEGLEVLGRHAKAEALRALVQQWRSE